MSHTTGSGYQESGPGSSGNGLSGQSDRLTWDDVPVGLREFLQLQGSEPPAAVENGVPVKQMLASMETIRANPDLAGCSYEARNRWLTGATSVTTVNRWTGEGVSHRRDDDFVLTADHPTLGDDSGPTPQELVLHALASCLTTSVVTMASARGIALDRVETSTRGFLDIRGILMIDFGVRNGFNRIEVSIDVEAAVGDDEIQELIRSAAMRSSVYDMLSGTTEIHGVG